MASLRKTYTKEKLKGQIFTPFFIVDKILDDVGYINEKILGKKILDPACGDGRFLIQIAKRILQYSPKNKIKENLEQIYGWDTDEKAVKIALEKLNALVKINVNWNIKVLNALEKIKKQNNHKKFDCIVGNPPYIRIQHLEKQERIFIQNHFSFCKKGATDIYLAFYAFMNWQFFC